MVRGLRQARDKGALPGTDPSRDVLQGDRVRGVHPQTATPDDQFGRGLLIVLTPAARWAVEKLTVGKTAWAELDIPKNQRSPPHAELKASEIPVDRRIIATASDM